MGARWVRMFGRMSGQKALVSLTIRQKYTVCYSNTRALFVRHEPDIPNPSGAHVQAPGPLTSEAIPDSRF